MQIKHVLISDLCLDDDTGLARALATVKLADTSDEKIDLVTLKVQQHFFGNSNIPRLTARFKEDAERWMGLMNFVELEPIKAAA